jgi:hypothetical protein
MADKAAKEEAIKKSPTTSETEVTSYLKYHFSEEEMKNLALDMAQATNKANAVEEKKKAANAGFKDELESHQLIARTAARKIEQGYEMKDIKCRKFTDYKKDLVTITRLDTGEVVEERKIKDSERQMSL